MSVPGSMAEHLASIYGTEKDKYTKLDLYHFFLGLTAPSITRSVLVDMEKSARGNM